MSLGLLVSGLAEILRRPLASAATIGGVAATVFVCGVIALAVVGLDGAFARGQGVIRFQVYWQKGADAALVARQMDWMRALPGVIEAKSFTPEAALAVMRGSLGSTAEPALPGADNPLPYTMLLGFALPAEDETFARESYLRLAGVDGVAEVRYNPAAVDAARSLGLLGSRAVLPLGAVLALLVGLVVGNTVRLSLLRRREELDIMRLVGATEWTIRLPLVSGAAATGLIGSGLAVAALAGIWSSLARELGAAPLWIDLSAPPLWLWLALIAGPTAIAALAGLAASLDSRP
ncbi:cell division protein FtsX [Desulfovibrio sp. TomC]|uniref:cell division protein FtsX n=1 Tax=Desulfovibrio sp. TomC TaxID=1562888 RepID=UPI000575BE77|nr:FtsX-like permease family protein [Desulfovibrio sp. TomC]KHK03099.1 Cell division protein FtsX [Desulfovibrio sp. TomC]